MDSTLLHIFLGEFGDPNCSLITDAFEDAFYHNSSLALMSLDGLYCNATTDEIGTCWPRSSSGRIVERPCPEFINGVKYNTTRPDNEVDQVFVCDQTGLAVQSFFSQASLILTKVLSSD
ncbi:hypothetical protein SRHO_G00031300 [Serrasalmus rhombeus]